MAVDTMGMSKEYIDSVKTYVTKETNIPTDAIFIHSTHSHTAGRLGNGAPFTEQEAEYAQTVRRVAVNAAVLAINDLKPTKMGWDVVLPCCNTNEDGYFPMQDSYDEGGYEAKFSSFKGGVAELIIEEGKKTA